MNHDLSSKQLEIKNNLEKDAVKSAIWISGIIGIFVFIILYLFFTGSTNHSTIKLVINAALGALSGYFAYKPILGWTTSKKTKEAHCDNCGSDYVVELVSHDEDLIAAVPRSKSERYSNKGDIRHRSWIEEKYNITDTYQCCECGKQKTNKYVVTKETGHSSSIT